MATRKLSKSPLTAGAADAKETLYIDVDDEITAIIDKVKASDKKIIALVLPKRATVLQSVVNMKLLKRAGTAAKKNIVLITSESGLLPLAGVAGLHVARSLQSKPEIPPPPHHADDQEAETVEDHMTASEASAPVGALAAAATLDSGRNDPETIELDNISPEAPAGAAAGKKSLKLKHLKIPNFERFRLGFFLAILGVLLLIGGWFLAAVVLPRATIAITTDTTTVVSSFDFMAKSALTEVNLEQQELPATLKELKKTDAEKVAATGEKDLGTKATGNVTLSIACGDVSSFPATVPAGTAVSTGGLNFITQEAASLSTAAGPGCRFVDTVPVAASQNGDQYNIGSGKSFTVAGSSTITGSNSAGFSGGTSNKVKVVSQKDVDDAVAKIKARLDTQASDELKAQFETEQLVPLGDTMKTGEAKITPSPAVDSEAAETTVTWEVAYTMLGINRDDLVELIKKDIETEVDLQKQIIVEDGISSAILRINNQASPSEAYLNFRTSVTAGPELDEEAIKEAVRGKKRGEAESYIGQQPGVKDVVVDYSPFWVYSTPKAAKKITIKIEKSPDQQIER